MSERKLSGLQAAFLWPVTGAALSVFLAASAAESPVYRGLNPGEPMKSWLVLHPTPS